MVLGLVGQVYNDARLRKSYQQHSWNSNTLFATLASVMENILAQCFRQPDFFARVIRAHGAIASPVHLDDALAQGFKQRHTIGDKFSEHEVGAIHKALER